MNDKKIIYIDMDGVLVAWPEDGSEPESFRLLPPMKGAIEAYHKLVNSGKFDVYILSTAPWSDPQAWTDKRLWVEHHLGAFKNLILSHNKHLNIGDYLIDDRLANGSDKFTGELIHFGTDKFSDWNHVLNYLNIK